jgi:hypothetical protein
MVISNGIRKPDEHIALFSDSIPGTLSGLDIRTGKAKIVVNNPATMKPFLNPLNAMLGINRLKYRARYLYYTNTWSGGLFRVALDCETGAHKRKVETITTLRSADGFAFTQSGDVIAATATGNTVVKITGAAAGGVAKV